MKIIWWRKPDSEKWRWLDELDIEKYITEEEIYLSCSYRTEGYSNFDCILEQLWYIIHHSHKSPFKF